MTHRKFVALLLVSVSLGVTPIVAQGDRRTPDDSHDFSSYTIKSIPGLNSSALDYSPTISADGRWLFFVSNRIGGHGGHDIWVAKLGSDIRQLKIEKIYPLGTEINTEGNEGNLVLSADGTFLVFTACNRIGGMGDCDLYGARLVDGVWKSVTDLRKVNSSDWDSQPTLSGSGDTLVFLSNRPGAVGGPDDGDLWMSIRGKDGLFEAPERLPLPINTGNREDSPFILPGTSTLYFASAGHDGHGGLDFFKSTLGSDGVWSDPVNLGEGINTDEDDRFITGLPDRSVFFFSSQRSDPENEGTLDIFAAVRPVAAAEDRLGAEVTGDLRAVPNPVADRFSLLSSRMPIDGTLILYDAYGEEIFRVDIAGRAIKVDVSGLPTGFYLMTLERADGTRENGTFVRRVD